MCQVTLLQWLLNLKPAVEDTVAGEGVGMGVDSPSEMSQDHYLARVVMLVPDGPHTECVYHRIWQKKKIW